MSSTQLSPTYVDATDDAIDFFLPFRPWNKTHNRLFILPPSSSSKPNPTLSSWCSAPQSHQWRDKPRSRCQCVYPNPILAPWKFWSSSFQSGYVLFFIQFFGVIGEGWRTKRNREKWCSMNGEKWWLKRSSVATWCEGIGAH